MIGPNIYKYRVEKGYTLSELAEKAGVSKSYLSNIERNLKQNPSIQLLEKVANVLEVDLKELLLSVQTADKPSEDEWTNFLNELNSSKLEGVEIKDYLSILAYIKWKKKQDDQKNL
ncbi:helix-turn-helix domain-containing protein [Jeotgalibacillus salarius]|uniref:XRE family transcriptional regulator n=1 Tax=Jeotgalibacillus salarius TaxID=546023 RepID=A0A4Y8LLU0_9BACL|nr:helix-turn-helix transcriptional regulator [Jeotgalibacillus salarius]TFE01695.1 XRE family transcriptional regulator [Jeotgalibacillus salarius]